MNEKYTYMKFYFTPEEHAYIKSKGRGFVRKLVQDSMNSPQQTLSMPTSIPKPMSGASMLRKVQGPTCKECGSMVMAGRCRVCGLKQ